MYEVVWTRFAEHELDNIFSYFLINAGENIARKIVLEVILTSDYLKINPHIGQIEELLMGSKRKYRYILSKNYKVIYTIDSIKKKVIILDVFDARQNPKLLKRNLK